jgi:hypothetical protein
MSGMEETRWIKWSSWVWEVEGEWRRLAGREDVEVVMVVVELVAVVEVVGAESCWGCD